MEKQIQRWIEKGIISKEIALELLADVKLQQQKNHKLKMNITIYTVAAILIGIGVITFVSANDWILKLFEAFESLKVVFLFMISAFSFWGGYKLQYETKKYPKFGYFLITLSSILIGATYALVGQTYNINANNSSLTLIWLLSILPIAYIFKNYAVNILSIILFVLSIVFFFAELNIDKIEAWSVFIPILVGAFLYSIGNIPVVLEKYNNFSLSYKIVGLIPIFTTLLILTCSVNHTYQILSPHYIMPIFLLIAYNLANYWFNKDSENSDRNNLLIVETSFIVAMLFFLFVLLLSKTAVIPLIIIFANVAIIAIIAFGFNYGYKFENSKIIGVTNWFLIIYLLVNYFRWGWTFMDKSLFFIFGGVSLLYLGIHLEKKRSIVKNKIKEMPR